jgi:hypothetical protein
MALDVLRFCTIIGTILAAVRISEVRETLRHLMWALKFCAVTELRMYVCKGNTTIIKRPLEFYTGLAVTRSMRTVTKPCASEGRIVLRMRTAVDWCHSRFKL